MYPIMVVKWFLEKVSESEEKWIIPIDKNPFFIGRSQNCNLTLLSKTVSRKHAEIYPRKKTMVLHDLDSTNGTFINGKRLKDRTDLADGDLIHFGEIQFRILLKDDGKKESGSGTMHMKSPIRTRKNDFVRHYDITKREEDVLKLIIEGQSTKQITEELKISFSTAKNHIANIFKKCDLHSRIELISLYNNFEDKK